MIYHRNLAVNGLSPMEISTRSVANMGTFDTVTIIEPVVRTGGGGYVRAPRGVKPERYRVTVRVTINGITHTDTQIVDDLNARVTANVRGITVFDDEKIMVSVNNVQVFGESEIGIHVRSVNINY